MAQNDARDSGVLPDGWAWTTIGEACEVVLGQSPPSSTYNTDGVGLPFYQGKAEFGDFYPTTVKWCSAPKKIAEAGDVLISVRAPVGPTNLCREKSCIGRGLSAVRPLAEMPSLYLLYCFRHIEPGWESKATGTTFSAISGSVLREQEIPLAPLPEQHRIVAEIETQFTRLEAGVAALKRAQANLRRYKASVLKAACEGRLVPTEAELARAEGRDYEPADVLLQRILAERRAKWGVENPGKKYKEPTSPDTSDLPELPEGWVWATTEQLAASKKYSLAIGPFGSNLLVEDYEDEGVPLVFVRNIRSGVFDGPDTRYVTPEKAQELHAHQVEPGDLLITKMGDPPGDACQYPTVRPPAIITSDCIKWTLSSLLPENLYFMHAINSRSVHVQILRITRGVAQKKVSLGRFKSIAIPLPPLSEQHRIVAEVERRLSVVAELEKQVEAALRRAERLRQAILKHAFEGKLVPQDPEDEPASALLARIQAERTGGMRKGKGRRIGKRKVKAEEGKPEQLKLL